MADAPKGLAKPMKVSPELEVIVGAGPMPRTEVTKKLWVYIKANKLQDATNKRQINPDAKLKAVLGVDSVDMFKMTGLISKHLSSTDAVKAKAA
jgi:chromatin remodeling complex protein RSC6